MPAGHDSDQCSASRTKQAVERPARQMPVLIFTCMIWMAVMNGALQHTHTTWTMIRHDGRNHLGFYERVQ